MGVHKKILSKGKKKSNKKIIIDKIDFNLKRYLLDRLTSNTYKAKPPNEQS